MMQEKMKRFLKKMTLPTTRMIYCAQVALEKRCGVDFTLDVKSDVTRVSLSDGYWYQATRVRIFPQLRRICREATRLDAIIDIGCGKGALLRFFSKFPFQLVDGLEYSEYLAEIARKNMRKLNLPSNVYVGNAATFDGLDPYNWFYLYNPFKEPVMEQFLKRLDESLTRHPRHIKVLYFNPWCRSLLLEHGFVETSYKKTLYEKIWGSFLAELSVFEK